MSEGKDNPIPNAGITEKKARKPRAKKSEAASIIKMHLGDLQPNPFWSKVQPGGQHFPEAVAELVQSVKKNGNWNPRFIARKVNDRYEIVFHHHLLQALRELNGDAYEVEVEIKDLSDEDMLKLLAAENADYIDNPTNRAERDLNMVLQAKSLIEAKQAEQADSGKDSKGRKKHQDASQGVGAGQISRFLKTGFSASKVKKLLVKLNPAPVETENQPASIPSQEEFFPGSDLIRKFTSTSGKLIDKIGILRPKFEAGEIQMTNDQELIRLIATVTDELNRLQAAISNRHVVEAA